MFAGNALSAAPWRTSFPTTPLFEEVVAGFLHFLETEPRRLDWGIQLPWEKEVEAGYMARRGETHTDPKYTAYDMKDVFHFRPDLHELLMARGIVLTPEQERWFRLCRELYDLCLDQLLNFLRSEIDLHFPKQRFSSRIRDAEDFTCKTGRNVLRINLYLPSTGKPGDLIGKPHPDRNAFTLHAGENTPGLYGVEPKKLYGAKPGIALVFPGDKTALDTDGQLPAFLHEIRVVNETSTFFRRWSIVFFAHSDTVLPEKARA